MLTRRAMAAWLAAAGSAVARGVAWKHFHHGDVPKPPTSGPTGELDEATLAILMATAHILTGLEKLGGPYAGYFGFQALNRPGYLGVYREFAEAVRHQAGEQGVSTYLRGSLDDRWSLLEKIESLSEGRFEVPIHRETLALFMQTDVWVVLGYDGWPGSPRGLDAYRRPFRSGASS